MDRRTFLKAVVAVPLAATCAVTASKAWPIGIVIGRSVVDGELRPAYAGDVIVGVWDGAKIVTKGHTMALMRHEGVARLVPVFVKF